MYESLSLLAMIRRLDRRSRAGVARLAAFQQQRFRRLLTHALGHSAFYRRRFHGIDPDHCGLSDLPRTSKSELMANFDDVVTDPRLKRSDLERFTSDPANVGRWYLGRYAVSHTSGSEGQPAKIVQDSWAMLLNFAVQLVRENAEPKGLLHVLRRLCQPARMAVVTQRFGFYPSGSAFAHLPAAVRRFLRVLPLSVFDPLPETVAQLNAFRPNYLTGYASSLEVMAREEQAGRLRLRSSGCLQQIVNISEPLPISSREWIEDLFGVHVVDHYAMGECLALSSGCPYYSGSHLNVDLAILEVVDESGRPVPDGVPGSKVLITNLYNRVQPFIRYEVGDVVAMSPRRCPCGSPFPLIQSVAGRASDRFWVKVDGHYRELPSSLFLVAVNHYPEVAEHQVVQTGINRFLLRAVPLPGKRLSAGRVRRLVMQSAQAEGLTELVALDVEIVAAIPPDRISGKTKRMVNLAGPSPGKLEPSSRPSGLPLARVVR